MLSLFAYFVIVCMSSNWCFRGIIYIAFSFQAETEQFWCWKQLSEENQLCGVILLLIVAMFATFLETNLFKIFLFETYSDVLQVWTLCVMPVVIHWILMIE